MLLSRYKQNDSNSTSKKISLVAVSVIVLAIVVTLISDNAIESKSVSNFEADKAVDNQALIKSELLHAPVSNPNEVKIVENKSVENKSIELTQNNHVFVDETESKHIELEKRKALISDRKDANVRISRINAKLLHEEGREFNRAAFLIFKGYSSGELDGLYEAGNKKAGAALAVRLMLSANSKGVKDSSINFEKSYKILSELTDDYSSAYIYMSKISYLVGNKQGAVDSVVKGLLAYEQCLECEYQELQLIKRFGRDEYQQLFNASLSQL